MTDNTKPFNLALHEHLVGLGYEYDRVPESWEDIGTGESGPYLTGGPAYDEYAGPDEFVYASADGTLDREARNPEFEQWLTMNQSLFSTSVH